jgi:hypothetical protein
MTNLRNTKATDLTIGPNDGHKRSKEKTAEIDDLARLHNSRRSAERLGRNALLAVQYLNAAQIKTECH